MTNTSRTWFLPRNRCRQPQVVVAAVLVLTLLGAHRPAMAEPLLSALSTAYPTGAGPRAVAVGDLNGDGKPDVVTANGTGTVSVLLGSGDGTLQAHVDYPAPSPGEVTLADFNSDGRPDVAVGNANETFSILLSNGDGSLRPGVQLANPGWRIGDVNGDGRLDLVAKNDNVVSVRLGVGDGSFAPPTEAPIGPGVLRAVGDLNQDGRLDLVVVVSVASTDTTDGWGDLDVLLGNGGGGFTPQFSERLWSNNPDEHIGTARVVVGDVNGDGIPDLACGFSVCGDTESEGCSTSSSRLVGAGDGTFRSTGDGRGYPFQTADLDGDGHSDLLVIEDGNVAVELRQPDGSSAWYGVPVHTTNVAVGDLNQDGHPDMVTLNSESAVWVLIANGNLSFGSGFEHSLNFSPTLVLSGDLNGDGRTDLVAAPDFGDPGGGDTSPVSVLLGDGSGGLGQAGNYSVGYRANAFALGHLNGDTLLDLAVADGRDGDIVVVMGDGAGGFGPAIPVPNEGQTRRVAIGDLNGDGLGDLVLLRYTPIRMMSVLLGHGDGTFDPLNDYANEFTSVEIEDLNRDGFQDLVLGNPGARGVSVMLGDGSGGLRPRVDFPIGQVPTEIALGDLNGDGTIDLVATTASSISVLLGDGLGSFVLRSQVPWNISGPPAIGDLNNDGVADLALPMGRSGVGILLGAGDGTFGTSLMFGTVGAQSVWVGIGDRNGDGRADLTVMNGGIMCWDGDWRFYCGGASVSVLYQNGSSLTPVALSLASAEVHSDLVRLTWAAEGAANLKAVVQRSDAGIDVWTELGTVTAATDRLVFEDRTIVPGTRYGYRLVVLDHGQETVSGPTWVTVPLSAILSLGGASPNPSDRGVAVRFSLPGDERATLELFDLRGRRIASREVGSLGAGEHLVPLTDRVNLPAGVYLVRLTQGPRTLTAKACVVR